MIRENDRKKTYGTIWILSLIALLSCLFIPLPKVTKVSWISVLLDLGHVPLFFAIMLIVDRLLKNFPILIRSGLVIGAIVFTEMVQYKFGRSSSVIDVVNGLAGVAIYFCWNCDCNVKPGFLIRSLITVVILIPPSYSCMPTILDAFTATQQFPILTDFSGRWETLRWKSSNAEVLADGTVHWNTERVRSATSKQGVQTENSTGEQNETVYSTIEFYPIVRDWTGFNRLFIEIQFDGNVEEEQLPVQLVIEDQRPAKGYFERFNGSFTLHQGLNQLEWKLNDVVNQPNHHINLRKIERLYLFTVDQKKQTTIKIVKIELVKDN